MEVALIGAGRMGAIHGRNAAAHPDLHLKYVVDPRQDIAEALARSLGAAPATLERVLADPEVGGILVCSSTDQHLAHALAGVDAGKAVFCEKPIDLDLQKARDAQGRFDGAAFLLAFNRRFDPHLLRLKQRLDAGEIGKLETLHITGHDPAAPPPGFVPTSGGLFKDFTIHDLDLARWLMNEEIVEVFAAASCLVDPEIGRQGDVDTARTVLKSASGRICVISNTRRSGYGYDQRVEAFGSAGMLAAGNVAESTIVTITGAAALAEPIKSGFVSRYAESYRNEMDHFVDVALGRAKLRVTYADGIAALVLAEACGESVKSGRAIRL